MAYKRKVEFSVSHGDENKLDMYSASHSYHFLGVVKKEDALLFLTKSQKTRLNSLYRVLDEYKDSDIKYMVNDEVVLSVNKSDFHV